MAVHSFIPPTAEIDRRIGRRLARRRREIGLTESELERAVGVPAGSIDRFEKGERSVSAAELLALSRVLGTTVSYFFHFDGPAVAEKRNAGSAGMADWLHEVAEAESFIEAYFRISDSRVRRDILGLLKAAADD